MDFGEEQQNNAQIDLVENTFIRYTKELISFMGGTQNYQDFITKATQICQVIPEQLIPNEVQMSGFEIYSKALFNSVSQQIQQVNFFGIEAPGNLGGQVYENAASQFYLQVVLKAQFKLFGGGYPNIEIDGYLQPFCVYEYLYTDFHRNLYQALTRTVVDNLIDFNIPAIQQKKKFNLISAFHDWNSGDLNRYQMSQGYKYQMAVHIHDKIAKSAHERRTREIMERLYLSFQLTYLQYSGMAVPGQQQTSGVTFNESYIDMILLSYFDQEQRFIKYRRGTNDFYMIDMFLSLPFYLHVIGRLTKYVKMLRNKYFKGSEFFTTALRFFMIIEIMAITSGGTVPDQSNEILNQYMVDRIEARFIELILMCDRIVSLDQAPQWLIRPQSDSNEVRNMEFKRSQNPELDVITRHVASLEDVFYKNSKKVNLYLQNGQIVQDDYFQFQRDELERLSQFILLYMKYDRMMIPSQNYSDKQNTVRRFKDYEKRVNKYKESVIYIQQQIANNQLNNLETFYLLNDQEFYRILDLRGYFQLYQLPNYIRYVPQDESDRIFSINFLAVYEILLEMMEFTEGQGICSNVVEQQYFGHDVAKNSKMFMDKFDNRIYRNYDNFTAMKLKQQNLIEGIMTAQKSYNTPYDPIEENNIMQIQLNLITSYYEKRLKGWVDQYHERIQSRRQIQNSSFNQGGAAFSIPLIEQFEHLKKLQNIGILASIYYYYVYADSDEIENDKQMEKKKQKEIQKKIEKERLQGYPEPPEKIQIVIEVLKEEKKKVQAEEKTLQPSQGVRQFDQLIGQTVKLGQQFEMQNVQIIENYLMGFRDFDIYQQIQKNLFYSVFTALQQNEITNIMDMPRIQIFLETSFLKLRKWKIFLQPFMDNVFTSTKFVHYTNMISIFESLQADENDEKFTDLKNFPLLPQNMLDGVKKAINVQNIEMEIGRENADILEEKNYVQLVNRVNILESLLVQHQDENNRLRIQKEEQRFNLNIEERQAKEQELQNLLDEREKKVEYIQSKYTKMQTILQQANGVKDELKALAYQIAFWYKEAKAAKRLYRKPEQYQYKLKEFIIKFQDIRRKKLQVGLENQAQYKKKIRNENLQATTMYYSFQQYKNYAKQVISNLQSSVSYEAIIGNVAKQGLRFIQDTFHAQNIVIYKRLKDRNLADYVQQDGQQVIPDPIVNYYNIMKKYLEKK